MKTHLVCFATPQYKRSQKRLIESAKLFGIDEIHAFDETDLKKMSLWKENIAIFQQSKGFGYWLWKPFLILQVLEKISDDDIVLYLDAGNEIIADLNPLFDLSLKQDMVLFCVHTQKNKMWTKRDAFIGLDCDAEYYYEAEQIAGSPQLYRANTNAKKFVKAWLKYCQNSHLLTDIPNIYGQPNLPAFKQHRHDQSLISLLALKQKLPVFRDPSQWGNDFIQQFPNSPYGQILNLHREKHLSIWIKIKNNVRTFITQLRYFLPLRRMINWLDVLTLSQSDSIKLSDPTLTTIRLQKPTKRNVFIRKSSKIDKIVLKYVFFNRYHQSPIPLSHDCTILDLGANIGLTMVDFKLTYPQSKVFGLEMDTQNYLLAQKNIAGFDDCWIENIAVWDSTKTVQYATHVDEDAYSISESQYTEGVSYKDVEAMSMDDILKKFGLRKVDYVKMDIEGAEKAVLRNGDRDWVKQVNCLNIEIHDPNFLEEAMQILENFGFDCRKDTNHWSAILAVRSSTV